MTKHSPLVGLLGSVLLLMLAASHYPGGTAANPESVGYDWGQNTISALFQPLALNGTENPGRRFAIPAVLLYCFSVGVVFVDVAKRAASRTHGKTIQIAGVGSMVYAALVVTPMHDLMVIVALAFFVVAMVAVLHSLSVERRFRLLAAGVGCVSLPIANAAMYFGGVLSDALPIVQKAGSVAWVSWLLAVYYSDRSEGPITRTERPMSDRPR